ncbi:MAG: hypothetical protein WKF84_24540 [Pyrinomonadaceae bacterium]
MSRTNARTLLVSARVNNGISQQGTDVRPLESGKSIERELAPGQSHSYQIVLASGQYALVAIEQKGIEVAVKLFGPNGNPVMEVEGSSKTQGSETVRWVAEAAGSYRLEISPPERNVKAGRYEVRLIEIRAATQQERDRFAARKLLAEVERLWGKGTKVSREEAIRRYQEALSFHHAAGEPDRRNNHSLPPRQRLYVLIGPNCEKRLTTTIKP